MAEDFDNYRRIFDDGDDLQRAAAVRAVFNVDVEDSFGCDKGVESAFSFYSNRH